MGGVDKRRRERLLFLRLLHSGTEDSADIDRNAHDSGDQIPQRD